MASIDKEPSPYKVNLVLFANDEHGLVEATKNFVEEEKKEIFKSYPLDSVENVIKNMLLADQGGFVALKNNTYKSEFEVYRNYWVVLRNWFRKIRPFLKRESQMTVHPNKHKRKDYFAFYTEAKNGIRKESKMMVDETKHKYICNIVLDDNIVKTVTFLTKTYTEEEVKKSIETIDIRLGLMREYDRPFSDFQVQCYLQR